jgi:hypothetical protein
MSDKIRYFKAVDVIKNEENDTYEIIDHTILGKNNRYKLQPGGVPYHVAKKVVSKIFQKDPQTRVINQLVLRETTRNSDSKLFFYQAIIQELEPDKQQKKIIKGKEQIFKNKIIVDAILPEVLKHPNPLNI